ncbi:MAG: hypothetical protein HYX21_00300 [Candidatus Yanofskybacteria bacterium]|nr:hypothetical protein [Candidatus Yanofskybacteria bacterium]
MIKRPIDSVPGRPRSIQQIERDTIKLRALMTFMPVGKVKTVVRKSLFLFEANFQLAADDEEFVSQEAEGVAWVLLRLWINVLLDGLKGPGRVLLSDNLWPVYDNKRQREYLGESLSDFSVTPEDVSEVMKEFAKLLRLHIIDKGFIELPKGLTIRADVLNGNFYLHRI